MNPFLEIRDFSMVRGGSEILTWTGHREDGERSSPSSQLPTAAPSVPIEVPRNRVTALLGANGSGKTSFLEACLGLLPYNGTLRVLGEVPPHANNRIGYVSQIAARYRSEFLRARDLMTIDLTFCRRGRDLQDFLDQYALAFDFDLDKRMSELSLGQVQKVAIARALLDQPEALFLDEPFSGLDRQSRGEILATLTQVKRLFSPNRSTSAHSTSVHSASVLPAATDSAGTALPMQTPATHPIPTSAPPANFNILIVTHDLHNLASIVDSALVFENFGITYLSDLTDHDLHGEGHHA